MEYYGSWSMFTGEIANNIKKSKRDFRIFVGDIKNIDIDFPAYINDSHFITPTLNFILCSHIFVVYDPKINELYMSHANHIDDAKDYFRKEFPGILESERNDLMYYYAEIDGFPHEFPNPNKILNKSNKNNYKEGMNNMTDLIKMKMVMKMIDGNLDENSLIKLSMVSSMLDGGDIDITEIMKTKLMTKFLIDDKMLSNPSEDLPIEKLMVINMLNEGSFSIEEFIKMKMMTSMLDEVTKSNNSNK